MLVQVILAFYAGTYAAIAVVVAVRLAMPEDQDPPEGAGLGMVLAATVMGALTAIMVAAGTGMLAAVTATAVLTLAAVTTTGALLTVLVLVILAVLVAAPILGVALGLVDPATVTVMVTAA